MLGGVEEEWGVLLFADAVGFVGAEEDWGWGNGGNVLRVGFGGKEGDRTEKACGAFKLAGDVVSIL